MTDYGLTTRTRHGMEGAERIVREELAKEGFGILSEIDVAATLQTKLGLDVTPYRILGACNPALAAQALEAERDIGLLLPCNVVVYTDGEGTVVAALNPATMVEQTGNPDLDHVAKEATARLERVIAAVERAV